MSSPYPPLQGRITYDGGPLQGGVVYEDHRSGFWDKVGSVLAGAGHIFKEALPYVAQAASIYASWLGSSASGRSDSGSLSLDLPGQSSYRSQPIPMPEPIRPRPVPDYKSEPIVRKALARLEQQQARRQPPASDWSGMQARSRSILNEIASSRGLPSYEEFHRQNGIVYNFEPRQSSLGVERYMQPEGQSSRWIQEDSVQVQRNLTHAQKPVSYRQSTGTRPTGESSALHQMIMRSNAARDQAARPQPQRKQTPAFHNREYLNERQKVLNTLFDNQVFNRTDMQYPYALKDGQKVDDPNVARMTAVANWILFRSKSIQWTDSQVKQLQQILLAGRESVLSPEQLRQLDIAARLHSILKDNEELPSFQRDDARAFTQGMKVLIDVNSHKGQVNERQLIEDMKFFMIDQGNDPPLGWVINQLTEFRPSNAAYNLMGGPRLGTIGWAEKYWDNGQQFDVRDKPINQAHHFVASFIDALEKGPKEASYRAKLLDDNPMLGQHNPQDVALSKVAIKLASEIRQEKVAWKDIPDTLYRRLTQR
jgi:hypothetical protein